MTKRLGNGQFVGSNILLLQAFSTNLLSQNQNIDVSNNIASQLTGFLINSTANSKSNSPATSPIISECNSNAESINNSSDEGACEPKNKLKKNSDKETVQLMDVYKFYKLNGRNYKCKFCENKVKFNCLYQNFIEKV